MTKAHKSEMEMLRDKHKEQVSSLFIVPYLPAFKHLLLIDTCVYTQNIAPFDKIDWTRLTVSVTLK